MSENHGSGAAAAGIIGLLVLLGRSCDGISPLLKLVDDIPPPHVPSVGYSGVDDFGTAVAKGVDLPPGRGPLHLPAGASEAEQAAIAGGRVEGEAIRVFHAGIHPRVALDRPADNPRLVALFPQNLGEYRAVYGIEATASAEAQIHRMNRHFAGAVDVERLKPGERLVDVLVAQDGPSPLVILGHSEDHGGVLVLPTGERMKVVDVHERCSAAGKRCIVLTCHGEDLHLDKELTPRDALAMWRAAQAKNRVSRMTIAEFALAMRQDQVTRETRRQIAVSGVGTGVMASAGGTYVYISGRKR